MNNANSNPADLFGQQVVDSAGNKIGTVDNVWVDDATDQLEFVAVKTGWLFGHNHIIPTADAQFDGNGITVPYDSELIKGAPTFGANDELSPEQEANVYQYYGIDRSTAPSPTGLAGGESTDAYGDTEDANTTTSDYSGNTGDTVTLSEEELQVGKREVEAGRVRLRKVVETRHEEVPVDLRREEVDIERVPVSDASAPSDAFEDREVEVPVMREEAVVSKEAHATEQVRLNKDIQTETRTVGGEVRREDVEVDEDVEPAYTAETNTAPRY